MSLCRQNYHEECEAGVNKQINMELYASYVYMTMAFHFNRDDVALNGFYKFFLNESEEERQHAIKLMTYQNMRGGRIVLQDISAPPQLSWNSGLHAMQDALDLEKKVNQSLMELVAVGERHRDTHFCDFINNEYLEIQVQSMKKLSDYITNLIRVGNGLGEYTFDKETLHGESQ
ncbi:ferritin, putative [Schistosoma mansoni]|uniref:Ferritin-1 heavy chain n=1 Tax=Schistosoma mansoni TaxID=6183 RepID=FRIH1_SCHMA|nr:ferritin, putative [Schistosoma mansoni]P25319.1 RecName: Full=Ferritin-1 heavy chain [Schistosoma mansoni]AAA29880.1 ferritin light chain [Schistosoma mansoni]|eukprot:XP_018645099.1 ferritin, putative [Schistosoma mansoni]